MNSKRFIFIIKPSTHSFSRYDILPAGLFLTFTPSALSLDVLFANPMDNSFYKYLRLDDYLFPSRRK